MGILNSKTWNTMFGQKPSASQTLTTMILLIHVFWFLFGIVLQVSRLHRSDCGYTECPVLKLWSKDYSKQVEVTSTIRSEHSSRHVPQVQVYETDELVYHGGMRVSFGMQLMAASSRIVAELPNISWPFLLLHGTADKLCDIRGSHLMYNQAKSTDKNIKVCVPRIRVQI